MSLTRALVIACGLAFIYFGIASLATPSVIADFHRFGLQKLRLLAGTFEILGGLGLLGGLLYRPALIVSSAGLAVMMLIAFAARVRVRDSVALSLPSFLFMLLNLYFLLQSLRNPGQVQ